VSDAARLAALLRGSRSAVALTGAGISVPSGIPDFRSPQTGIWANVDPMAVAHIDAFNRDPVAFWGFYGQRFALLDGKEPNGAHRALAALEAGGHLRAVVTQNIDGLHAAAGSRDIVEVHGSVAVSRCSRDDGASRGVRAFERRSHGRREYPLADVRARLAADPEGVPRCDCGAPLRPGVVLFGELLPAAAIDRATELAARADLLLCVGSSLVVHPVAGLPELTLAAGGRVAIVTQSETPFDRHAAVRLGGDVEQELAAVMAAL
jgi:NAD-dependent deacetylase